MNRAMALTFLELLTPNSDFDALFPLGVSDFMRKASEAYHALEREPRLNQFRKALNKEYADRGTDN